MGERGAIIDERPWLPYRHSRLCSKNALAEEQRNQRKQEGKRLADRRGRGSVFIDTHH